MLSFLACLPGTSFLGSLFVAANRNDSCQKPSPHSGYSLRASVADIKFPRGNFFLNTNLNRPDSRNKTSDFRTILAEADESVFFLPQWNGHLIIDDKQLVFWNASQLQAFISSNVPKSDHGILLIPLCQTDNPPAKYVAVDVSQTEIPPLSPGQIMLPARRCFSFLSETHATIVAHSKALVSWHASSKFCSQCGNPTELIHGATARACNNQLCSTGNIYPRIMPSVLVLVIRPETDEVLLGRKASWVHNRYSVLAGYTEIFESLEQTVAREVQEETGVIVDENEVMYHSSQPWPSSPYPSLLCAFRAHVHGERNAKLAIDSNELEDAQWFKRKWLQRCLTDNTGVNIPGRTSVARRLILEWVFETTESSATEQLIP